MGRILFIFLAFGLFAVIVAGLFWVFALSPATPIGIGWFLFSFAAGLTMIVLPCTLPLAFVIVPMVMGKSYGKGFLTAVSFSLGVALTLSAYGILAAVLGKAVFGFAGDLETVKNIFYALAGIFAILFALGELGILKVRLPSYGGSVPSFIQERKDILKPFLMGLFLGNIGVGCPHPATPMILGQIGIVGSVFYGWLLFFVHALGRIVPLLVLAMLGILGINATRALVAHRDAIAKATAWGMVVVGGFLFTLGFFGHGWWVYSGQHVLFEEVTQEERFVGILSERLQVVSPHKHGLEELEGATGLFDAPLWLGNWVLVGLWVLPMIFTWFLARRKARILQDPERGSALAVLRWKGAFVAAVSLALGLVFINILPHWFLVHKALEPEKVPEVQTVFSADPASPAAGIPVQLNFALQDKAGKPLSALQVYLERILHVIIVSEDLKIFAHIHPEDFVTVTQEMIKDARFPLYYSFPQTGRYLIAAGYTHGAHEVSRTFLFDVGERGIPLIVKDLTAIKNFNGYQVSLLKDPDPLISGKSVVLTYQIEENGAPIVNFEPYLGAPMHLAIVSADLNSFEHTHGEIHEESSKIEAHVVFPHPGLYQIFGEFKYRGRVIVTSFLVEVEAGEDGMTTPMHVSHE